jgi:hypothetical protein
LKRLRKLKGQENRKELNECLMRLIATVANATLAVAHPVLHSGGRDMTVFFSPSRSSMASVHHNQEKKHFCVCCKRRLRRQTTQKNKSNFDPIVESDKKFENLVEAVEEETLEEYAPSSNSDKKFENLVEAVEEETLEEYAPSSNTRANKRGSYSRFETEEANDDSEYEESYDELDGDHELDADALESVKEEEGSDADYDDSQSDVDDGDDLDEAHTTVELGRGKIEAIPKSMCQTASMGVQHFACESCIEKIQECPRCKDLLGRLRKTCSEKDETSKTGGQVFCPNIFGGFCPSTKLQAVVSSFDKIPQNEKALVVSFYKGSLDLLERVFTDLYPNIKIARFDGDIGVNERAKVLEEFKSTASCRILLMTVKTGGVGLNLIEANHVLFVDRNCK